MARFTPPETGGTLAVQVIAVVITGGLAPRSETVAGWFDKAALVVAADSGLDTAIAYGVRPDLVVGDFDSVSSEEALSGFGDDVLVRFPRDKEETDTEIGIRISAERGADEIVLIGGGGGRLDHLFGIYELFQRDLHPSWWITDTMVLRSVDDEIVVHGSPGETVSFIPVGPVVCRMSSQGLRWPLDGLTWSRGDIGISNEFASQEVRVKMMSGRLLMVRVIGDGV
jgi:thiamine pyrophosphokinase